MQVTLEYFAQVRQAAGVESEQVQPADGTDIVTLLTELADRHGEAFRGLVLTEAGAIRPSLVVLVNGHAVSRDEPQPLADGDQITILSPMAGG